MPLFDEIAELLRSFAPFLAVLAVVLSLLMAMRWLLLRNALELSAERKLPRQMTMFGLTALGLVAVILALPVSDSTRNQLLTMLGLLASAIIALSSTTLVANAMAGLMLRSTRAFRTGDFIRVERHFGRVTVRGLLDTEIQTEDRELTMLPNLYLISNPVTVVRSSGTLVSVSLSLGYDAHHARIEPLLIEAAKRAELDDPFVRVMELGNFAVTYRVSGFLEDIKNLLTARSNLGRMVLDVLHGQGIEIMSPTIMNQRPTAPDARFIPTALVDAVPMDEQTVPEDIMFDKAERAERIEHLRLRLQAQVSEIESRLAHAEGEEHDRLESQLERRRKQLGALLNVSADTKASA